MKIISPAESFKGVDFDKIRKNLLMFVAPTLVVFFGQLALGVEWKLALPVAMLAFWQSMADLFKKWKEEVRK